MSTGRHQPGVVVAAVLLWTLASATVGMGAPTGPPPFENCAYSEPPPQPVENGDTTDKRHPEVVYQAFEGAPRPTQIWLHTGGASTSTRRSLEVTARGLKRLYPGLVRIAEGVACTKDDEVPMPEPADGEEYSESLVARQEYPAPERLRALIDSILESSEGTPASVLLYTDCDSLVDLALQHEIPVSFYIHQLRGQQFTKGMDMFARFYHVAPAGFSERGQYTRGFKWEFARQYLETFKKRTEMQSFRESVERSVRYWTEYYDAEDETIAKDKRLRDMLQSDVDTVIRMAYEGLRNAVVTTTHFSMEDLRNGVRGTVQFMLQNIVKVPTTDISSDHDVIRRMEAFTLDTGGTESDRWLKSWRGEEGSRFGNSPEQTMAKVMEKGYVLVTPDLLGKSNCYITQWFWKLGMDQYSGPVATVPLDRFAEYLNALMDDGNPIPRHILFADDNSCTGDQLQQFFGVLLEEISAVQARIESYVGRADPAEEGFRFEITLAPLFSTVVARQLQLDLVKGDEDVLPDPHYVQHAITKKGEVPTLGETDPAIPVVLHVISFNNLHTVPHKVGHRIRRFPAVMDGILRDEMSGSFDLENMVTAHFDWKVVDLVSMPKMFVRGFDGRSGIPWRFLSPVCPPYKISKAHFNAMLFNEGSCTGGSENDWSGSEMFQELYCDSLEENIYGESFAYTGRTIVDAVRVNCRLGKGMVKYAIDPRYLDEGDAHEWSIAENKALTTMFGGEDLGNDGDVAAFPGVPAHALRKESRNLMPEVQRRFGKRSRDER